MSFLTGNGAENALSCFLKIKYDFIFQWFSEQKKREKEKEKRQWRKLSFKHKIFKEQSYFVVCYLPLVSEGPNTLAMNKEKIIMIMVQVNRSLVGCSYPRYEHLSFMTFLKILRTIQLRKFDKADSMRRCFLSAKPELFNHKQANLKTSSVKIESRISTTMTLKIHCKLNVLNLQALLREMQFACS